MLNVKQFAKKLAGKLDRFAINAAIVSSSPAMWYEAIFGVGGTKLLTQPVDRTASQFFQTHVGAASLGLIKGKDAADYITANAPAELHSAVHFARDNENILTKAAAYGAALVTDVTTGSLGTATQAVSTYYNLQKQVIDKAPENFTAKDGLALADYLVTQTENAYKDAAKNGNKPSYGDIASSIANFDPFTPKQPYLPSGFSRDEIIKTSADFVSNIGGIAQFANAFNYKPTPSSDSTSGPTFGNFSPSDSTAPTFSTNTPSDSTAPKFNFTPYAPQPQVSPIFVF